MTGKELYKIYAPLGARWVEWVRPVPFANIDIYNRKMNPNLNDRDIIFLNQYDSDAAIFIDLIGNDSIEFGIGLAKIGYRPIPIFNGTDGTKGARTIIDSNVIESSLINGGEILKNIYLNDNANPAFLLDSCRTNRYRKSVNIYDNSWDLYKQDIPTAKYFKENKINKIIVVGDEIQRDLKKIFLSFQSEGIEIYLTDGYIEPKKVILKKTIKELFEKEEL